MCVSHPAPSTQSRARRREQEVTRGIAPKPGTIVTVTRSTTLAIEGRQAEFECYAYGDIVAGAVTGLHAPRNGDGGIAEIPYAALVRVPIQQSNGMPTTGC